MNLDEALGKITDPDAKAFFTKMVSDQNSYITKLEKQLTELKTSSSNSNVASGVDGITQEYIRKKMREEVISNATRIIIESVGNDIYNAVKPDFEAFLDKNLKPENTKEDYVIDAFNLVYGRCYAKKDHPVHQIGKTASPNGTPSVAAGTNGEQVAAVQNVISGQPPIMSGQDLNAGKGLPGVQGTPVKTTKDAFARFKDRIANSGGNKFQ